MNCSDCCFDEVSHATALPMYEGVDYSKLKIGAAFFVMEGGNVVGEGIVEDIYQHQSVKEHG